MSLKLGIQHDWALRYYQVCSNDNPRLTFDLFTESVNLLPYTYLCCSFFFKN